MSPVFQEPEIDGLRRRVRTQQVSIEGYQDEIEELNERIAQLEAEVLVERSSNYADRCEKAQARIAQLEAELNVAVDGWEHLVRRIAQLEAVVERVREWGESFLGNPEVLTILAALDQKEPRT